MFAHFTFSLSFIAGVAADVIRQVTYREEVSRPGEQRSWSGTEKAQTLGFYQETGEDRQIYRMTAAIIGLTNQPPLRCGRPRWFQG